jgi:hypothetical protein
MPTQGQVHQVFLRRTSELADHARHKSDAARGQAQRKWDAPEDWSGDPQDIVGLVTPFDRSEIDQNYAQLLASGDSPGTAGDVVAVKTQGDYVALQERGLRTRYASSLRCLAHATARWKGHGNPKGVFHDGVIRYVQDAIKAGGSG